MCTIHYFRVLFCILIISSYIIAASEDSLIPPHSIHAATDTEKPDNSTDSNHSNYEEPKEDQENRFIVVRESDDTVFVLNHMTIRYLLRNWQKNLDILRHRSIGISGSSTYGTYAISIAPVKDLIDNDPFLSKKQFRFNRYGSEPFFTTGGGGVLGLGSGFRIGGSGMTGQRSFSSKPFNADSVLLLNVTINSGGFLVEKATVYDRWNITAGGIFGGGSMIVSLSEKKSSSWFTDLDDDNAFDELFQNDGNSVEAEFFQVEPYCGVSYTLFPFFHLGIHVSAPAFFSVDKFTVYTSDFFTINPGFSLKLIFGNLG